MANFFDKALIKVGLQQKKEKFDLSSTLITTQDFYKMKPVYIKEMVPGETVNIDMQAFSRLTPLVEPMYGSINIVNRAFFIPCRTIMEGWNDFITQSPHHYSNVSSGSEIITNVPRVTNTSLINAFMYNLVEDEDTTPSGWITPASATAVNYDWEINGNTYYIPSGVETTRFNLTRKGKIIYDILCGLGYKLNTSVSDSTVMSALPLLAYAKIWVDWYANPAYDTTAELDALFTGKREILQYQQIQTIFETIWRVCYNSDYFTSAWDNPVAPNNYSSLEGSISIQDITNDTDKSVVTNTGTGVSTGTPVIQGKWETDTIPSAKYPINISQYAIDALKRVTDYVKRHQLVGSRALDRYMAQFGVQLESEKLNRSVYLAKKNFPIQISDVMQTSNDIDDGSTVYGSNSGLGNYAGKGLGYGQHDIKYTTDEFGYLVITSYIEPKVSYVQGRPRILQHLGALDFFNGDFDNLGVQAIRQDELSTNTQEFTSHGITTTGWSADAIFGYTPRYAEYKTAQDNMTGDFLLNSKNTSLDGWYMARKLDLINALSQGLIATNGDGIIKHNYTFCLGQAEPFTNIFADQTTKNDHFISVFRFNVDSYMPMKKLYDTWEFDSDGKTMKMEVNGTQVTN